MICNGETLFTLTEFTRSTRKILEDVLSHVALESLCQTFSRIRPVDFDSHPRQCLFSCAVFASPLVSGSDLIPTTTLSLDWAGEEIWASSTRSR